MLSKLIRFFSPPQFEDEEKNRIARILYVLLLTLFVAALVIGFVEAVAGSPSSVPVIAMGSSLLLGVLWLTKQGKLQAASMFLLMIMTGMVTVLLSIGQGVHDIGMILYPTIIIIAALLLDRRNFIIVVAVNILSVGFIIFGGIAGIIVTGDYMITTRPVDFVIVGTLLVLAAYAIRLLAAGKRNRGRLSLSEIMAPDSTCSMPANFLASSSACIPMINLRGRVSVWPSSAASTNGTGGACGRKGNWTKGRPFISRWASNHSLV